MSIKQRLNKDNIMKILANKLKQEVEEQENIDQGLTPNLRTNIIPTA